MEVKKSPAESADVAEKKAWPMVRLGDIEDEGRIVLGRGKVISKNDISSCPGDYPVYSSSATGNGEIGRYGRYMFDDERLTWSIDGGGRWFYRNVARYSVTNVCGWLKVVDPQIDIKYLYYALTCAWQKIDYNYVHKAHPSVVRNEYCIPLPPLTVQREIVSRLEKELGEVDRLAAKFKRVVELADDAFKAELDETFKAVEGEKVRLGDVCDIDGSLVTDYERYAKYPHIGIDSIEKTTGRILGYRTVEEDNVRSGKYYFTKRHIIYSKIRPNLNKVAVPEFDGLCSADSYPLLPKEACDRYWLAYMMRSKSFLEYVVPISNNRTGMPKVNRSEVLAFTFSLPPLTSQHAIVAKLDAAKERCERLKVAALRGLTAAENLRKAILAEAFE